MLTRDRINELHRKTFFGDHVDFALAIEREVREECAKVADSYRTTLVQEGRNAAEDIATLIRTGT